MRFIDINTMIGPYLLGEQSFNTAEGLIKEMDRLGIECAFTYHTLAQSHDPQLGNNALVSEIAPHQRLLGAMVLTSLIDAEFGGKDKVLSFIEQNDIAAIRLYPKDHNYLLDVWNVEDLFEIAGLCSLPIFLDMRQSDSDLGDQYPQIYELAKAYPEVKIILLTVGYRHSRILMKLFEKCPNICVDTSTFINFRGIETVVQRFGAERILFGSRMPRIEAGVSVGRIIYADISEADKQKIAYGNAMSLLKTGGRCS